MAMMVRELAECVGRAGVRALVTRSEHLPAGRLTERVRETVHRGVLPQPERSTTEERFW